MNNALICFLLLFTLSVYSQDSTVIKLEVPENIIIIDNRTKAEYDIGHLEGAILIPHNEIQTTILDIVPDKDTPIALYCKSGKKSGKALKYLQALGYNNATNYGGINEAKDKLNRKIIK